MNEDLQLVITNDDVRKDGNDRLADRLLGQKRETLLGKDEVDLVDSLMEVMPKIITRKVKHIIPKEFDIVEIGLTFKLNGSVGFLGINGEVQVKIKPK